MDLEANQGMASDGVNPLRRCPECGYRLDGLPHEGRCPECGRAYGAEEIVIYGWAASDRMNPITARSRGTALLSSRGLAIAGAGLWCYFATASRIGVLVMVSGLCIAIAEFFRRHNLLRDMAAPVQLRFCPEGYGIRTGFGKVQLDRWTARTHVEFRLSPIGWIVSVHERLHFTDIKLRQRPIAIEFHADVQFVEDAQDTIARWK